LQGPTLPGLGSRFRRKPVGRAAILLLTKQHSQTAECARGSKGRTDESARNGGEFAVRS